MTQSSQVKSLEEQDFDVNKCAQNGDVPIMRSFRSVSRKNTFDDSVREMAPGDRRMILQVGLPCMNLVLDEKRRGYIMGGPRYVKLV